MIYRHVILGVDLHPNCDQSIIKKALDIVKCFGAELTIVHAVEHLHAYGIGQVYPGILDVEDELLKAARTELSQLCEKMGLADKEQIVAIGSPKGVLFEAVAEKNADLIIVGSHGRHGLALLLGSTANAILHNTACDVLAIRIPE